MINSVEDERERMVILFSSRMTINIIIVMIIIILNQEFQATKKVVFLKSLFISFIFPIFPIFVGLLSGLRYSRFIVI